MATRRFGISRGENNDQVTEAVGAACATDNIELTFDLAVSLTREDVLMGIEKIKNAVTNCNWPPA